MKILFIIGSLREKSFNKELAKKTQEIIGDRAEVSYLNYSNIPFMNQDVEKNLPEVVKDIRQQVLDSDAIWIFTPEYNGMIPGVLKNLLDWLSRPLIPGDVLSGTAVKGKPVTVSGAGGRNATQGSRGQLDTLLKRIGMNVMADPSYGYAVPPAEMKADDWKLTEEDIKNITNQVEEFLKFI